jgi:hypothetical protein
VHPDKQKILYKGKYLKEDGQIQSLQVKEGEIFMLMGTAEGKGMDLEKVSQKMFIEDMTEEQIATHYQKTLGVIWLTKPGNSVLWH